MGFLSAAELGKMGFRRLGRDVKISDKASIYGAANISIGDESRIDDFCILSAGDGGIEIGGFVHVAAFSSLIGREAIVIGDYAGLSSRVSIYSSSDDYSGGSLTNPTVEEQFKCVDCRSVLIGRHVIIGAGSVVLPGVTLHEGAAIGVLSLVKSDCAAFVIYAGVPAMPIKERRRDLLAMELQHIQWLRENMLT